MLQCSRLLKLLQQAETSVTAAAEDGVPAPSSGMHAAFAPAGDDMQLLQPRNCSQQHFVQDDADLPAATGGAGTQAERKTAASPQQQHASHDSVQAHARYGHSRSARWWTKPKALASKIGKGISATGGMLGKALAILLPSVKSVHTLSHDTHVIQARWGEI